MANFADSVWNAAQYLLAEMMQKPEFKYKPSSALMTFLKNTDFLVPASQREAATNQKNSDSQTVEIYTINKQSTTTISNRAYNHSGSNGDSTKTTASYTTYGSKFKYSIKQSDRQVFTLAEMLAKQILSAAIDTHGAIETALITSLNTNKSQVSVTPVVGAWDSTNYIFQVNATDEDIYFQRIQGFMNENYYKGMFDVISNAMLAQKGQYLVQQGQGNATNLGWQMAGLDHKLSVDISNDSGYQGMSYIVPMGTIGVLPWIPQINQTGFGDPFQNGGGYRAIPDPLGSGLTFAVHEYASGADNNSTYGERQDVDVEVELSVDLAPIYAPMSTSNASPVFKTGLLV
jgi:hypothetical protein